MAIAFRAGTSNALGSAAESITLTAPTGIQDNDLLLAIIDRATVATAITTPSGWAQVTNQTADYGGGQVAIYYKIASSESGDYTWSWTGDGNSFASGVIMAVSGVDTTAPFTRTPGPSNGDSATPDPPSTGAAAASLEYMVLAAYGIGGKDNNYASGNQPSGFTGDPTNLTAGTTGGGAPGAHCATGMAYKIATLTTDDPGTFTVSNSTFWRAFTLLIKPSAASPVVTQESYRIRSEDNVGLNVDSGWAAAKNTNAFIRMDRPFRIRFGLQCTAASKTDGYELWAKPAGGSYAAVASQATPWTPGTSQPAVMIVPSGEYTNQAATTELLADSGTFVAGQGIESGETTAITTAAGEDTEIEFNILIRALNQDIAPRPASYEFQLRFDDGTVLDSYTRSPTVIPLWLDPNGTLSETPHDNFIVLPSGVVYYVGEVTDVTGGTYDNELVVLKATNAASPIWTAPDFANRPGDTDIESVDVQYVAADNKIYIAYQLNSSVKYIEFNTSTDAYGTAESVDSSVARIGTQSCGIARRSDGTTICAYSDGDGTNSRTSIKFRTSGGVWDTTPTDLDAQASVDVHGATLTVDSNDDVHAIYCIQQGGATDGDLWHVKIRSSDDGFDSRIQVNDVATTLVGNSASGSLPHASPRIWDNDGVETIAVMFVDDQQIPHFTQSPVGTVSFITDEQISTTAALWNAGGSNRACVALAPDEITHEMLAFWVDDAARANLKTAKRSAAGSWGSTTTYLTAYNDWDGLTPLLGMVNAYSAVVGTQRVLYIVYEDSPGIGGTGGPAMGRFVLGDIVSASPAATTWTTVAADFDWDLTIVAVPAATTWTTQAATLTEGTLTVNASPANTTWTTVPAVVDFTIIATPTVSTWFTQPVTWTAGPATFTASPAATTWTVPAATLTGGAITLTAVPAATTWTTVAATLTEGTITISAAPATTTWSTVAASFGGPITVNAAPANTTWTTVAAVIDVVVLAAPAASTWSVPAATLTENPLVLTAVPAATTWTTEPATWATGPITVTASPVLSTWFTQAAPWVPGSITVSASPAATTWTTVPAVFSGDITVTASPALTTWSTVAASFGGDVTITADPAATAWTVPAAVIDVVVLASPALTAWTTVWAPLTWDVTVAAVPSVTSWSASPASFTAGAVTVEAAPAGTTWTTVGAQFNEVYYAAPAVTTWSASPAAWAAGPVTFTAAPAPTTWTTSVSVFATGALGIPGELVSVEHNYYVVSVEPRNRLRTVVE